MKSVLIQYVPLHVYIQMVHCTQTDKGLKMTALLRSPSWPIHVEVHIEVVYDGHIASVASDILVAAKDALDNAKTRGLA